LVDASTSTYRQRDGDAEVAQRKTCGGTRVALFNIAIVFLRKRWLDSIRDSNVATCFDAIANVEEFGLRSRHETEE
jgi:hypothetical protein